MFYDNHLGEDIDDKTLKFDKDGNLIGVYSDDSKINEINEEQKDGIIQLKQILQKYIIDNKIAEMKYFLDAIKNINDLKFCEYDLWKDIAQCGKIEMLELVLSYESYQCSNNIWSDSLQKLFVEHKRTDFITKFVKLGNDINNSKFLFYAKDIETAKYLINKVGADVNSYKGEKIQSVISNLSISPELFEFYISRGADVNCYSINSDVKVIDRLISLVNRATKIPNSDRTTIIKERYLKYIELLVEKDAYSSDPLSQEKIIFIKNLFEKTPDYSIKIKEYEPVLTSIFNGMLNKFIKTNSKDKHLNIKLKQLYLNMRDTKLFEKDDVKKQLLEKSCLIKMLYQAEESDAASFNNSGGILSLKTLGILKLDECIKNKSISQSEIDSKLVPDIKQDPVYKFLELLQIKEAAYGVTMVGDSMDMMNIDG